MTVKFLENTHKTLINPIKIKQKASKTQESKEIQKLKLDLSPKLLTKRKESIIIPVQFDWNASTKADSNETV